jgi:hypothetical protein
MMNAPANGVTHNLDVFFAEDLNQTVFSIIGKFSFGKVAVAAIAAGVLCIVFQRPARWNDACGFRRHG